ncbi:MAG: SDR family oxidoreductase [Acidobacteriota bacterium]|nr:SDR family oxidoreductase [Acidobacteriota bacterium]MDQ3420827.1 SDR family oxidoreductase [Acidobacteriota bacterium]
MKLLILGAAGMLGHKLFLTASPHLETWATVRDTRAIPADAPLDRGRILVGVEADNFDTVVRAVEAVRPDVVVSCIGVVKQRGEAKDPIVSLTVNSLFPHRLAALCRSSGARLIHVSTDCVFAGRKGRYVETDEPDAVDLYGRTKQLGEVSGPGALTLRTSIIGRELATSQGLVEWFLAQKGTAPGFTEAIFSGLTTIELSRVILRVIGSHPSLEGIYHVAADPISKYDLLVLLNRAFGMGLTIESDDSVRIDRSLDGRRFRVATGYDPPTWPEMIGELAADDTPYDRWRGLNAG